jgi:hypothetical protein
MEVVVVEDIKIDRSRGVEGMILRSPQGLLDALQGCEQVEWREGARDLDGGIEKERRTGRAINWFCLINTRAQERPAILMEALQTQSGRLEQLKALVQIRSERDANPHFKPRTSCMS